MDILFCYSTSFPAYGDLLSEFSYTLGHKLRPGAQVQLMYACTRVWCLIPCVASDAVGKILFQRTTANASKAIYFLVSGKIDTETFRPDRRLFPLYSNGANNGAASSPWIKWLESLLQAISAGVLLVRATRQLRASHPPHSNRA